MAIERTFVQTTLFGKERLSKIVKTGILGRVPEATGSNPPRFKDVPISYCSYLCKGYTEVYGGSCEGVIFKSPLLSMLVP